MVEDDDLRRVCAASRLCFIRAARIGLITTRAVSRNKVDKLLDDLDKLEGSV